MNLPSVEFLKEQANRLVTYLGDKHRFRLKPASALEALASMYRQDDWNTLHALAGRTTALARGPVALDSCERYPITWTAQYTPELTVTDTDWFRHTLAVGGTKSTRREWLEQQLLAHLERSAAGVFVNLLGAEHAGVRDLRELTQASIPGLPPEPLVVNLLADMAPDEIAVMLVGLVFSREEVSAAGYWVHSAVRVLGTAAQALRESGEAVTLARLGELFPAQATPKKLWELAARLAHGSSAREHLTSFLQSHSGSGGEFSANAWAAHYSVLSKALERLQREPWAPGLFASASAAPGLYNLLAQGKCLSIDWPEGTGEKVGVAVLQALRSALRARQLPSERCSGWVFALGELPEYLAPAVVRMLEQGRQARVAILMTARDSQDLSHPPLGQAVLGNVCNTVHLRGCSPERLAELLASIGDGPVLVQPGRLTASLRPR